VRARRVTLACASHPSRSPQTPPVRWLDGFQHFTGAPYSPGLCLVLDVRYIVPAAGSSAPAGWALLPVFERAGPFVASGAYQLPLMQVARAGEAGRGWCGQWVDGVPPERPFWTLDHALHHDHALDRDHTLNRLLTPMDRACPAPRCLLTWRRAATRPPCSPPRSRPAARGPAPTRRACSCDSCARRARGSSRRRRGRRRVAAAAATAVDCACRAAACRRATWRRCGGARRRPRPTARRAGDLGPRGR
jgi:hypothetical protein